MAKSTVEIHENVRGQDVFLVQSTCAPTNDNLMELMIMADAIQRASAQRITAVMPYFGYARGRTGVRSARVPISAKVVADMLGSVGIDRVLTVDLHADQIQGFFTMPVDNVYGSPVLVDDASGTWHGRPGRYFTGCRRCGSGAGHRQAARRRRPGHHRQAAAARQRNRGDERDR